MAEKWNGKRLTKNKGMINKIKLSTKWYIVVGLLSVSLLTSQCKKECITCPIDKALIDGECKCPPNTFEVNGICRVDDGTFYVDSSDCECLKDINSFTFNIDMLDIYIDNSTYDKDLDAYFIRFGYTYRNKFARLKGYYYNGSPSYDEIYLPEFVGNSVSRNIILDCNETMAFAFGKFINFGYGIKLDIYWHDKIDEQGRKELAKDSCTMWLINRRK